MNEYKHPSELPACDNCNWLKNKNRHGCHWRSEIPMLEDKSPCLNYEKERLLDEK